MVIVSLDSSSADASCCTTCLKERTNLRSCHVLLPAFVSLYLSIYLIFYISQLQSLPKRGKEKEKEEKKRANERARERSLLLSRRSTSSFSARQHSFFSSFLSLTLTLSLSSPVDERRLKLGSTRTLFLYSLFQFQSFLSLSLLSKDSRACFLN